MHRVRRGRRCVLSRWSEGLLHQWVEIGLSRSALLWMYRRACPCACLSSIRICGPKPRQFECPESLPSSSFQLEPCHCFYLPGGPSWRGLSVHQCRQLSRCGAHYAAGQLWPSGLGHGKRAASKHHSVAGADARRLHVAGHRGRPGSLRWQRLSGLRSQLQSRAAGK